ncbi:MAG: carboxypeptidase regulatory-like domain-containing protein [bacterium]|nr:carboxypeptidase regulatory-like domain-containing protein [bacterium]
MKRFLENNLSVFFSINVLLLLFIYAQSSNAITQQSIPLNLAATAISSSQINLTWTDPVDKTDLIGYKIYRDSILIDTTPQTTYSDTNTQQATTYSYTVAAFNATIESNQSTSASATTSADEAGTPTIVNIAAATTKTTARITWNTDQQSTSEVRYGFTINYGQASPVDETLTTSHEVTLANLSPGTEYHYRIRAKNASNNLAVSLDKVFTTISDNTVDTMPPAKITDLAASNLNSTSIDLTWTSPGDDNTTGTAFEYDVRYHISLLGIFDDAMKASGEPLPKIAGTQQTYVLVGLSPGTAYEAALTARDESGNISAISNTTSFTTTFGSTINTTPDQTPTNPSAGSGQAPTTNKTDAPKEIEKPKPTISEGRFLGFDEKGNVIVEGKEPENIGFVETIQNINQGVAYTVKKLQANPEVIKVIEAIAVPVAVGVSAASAGAITISAAAAGSTGVAVGLAQVMQVLNTIRFSLLGLLRFRRKKPWGHVVDQFTGSPIISATIQIYDAEFNKLKDTQRADGEGRFGTSLKPGTYFIKIAHRGFQTFASKPFTVTSSTQVLNLEFALITEHIREELTLQNLKKINIKNAFARTLDIISPYLLVVGSLISFASVVLVPSFFNLGMASLYIVFDSVKIIISRRLLKPFGLVVDEHTKKPIALAVIRIFNQEKNWLVGTKATNEQGQFQFLLEPGSYYITCSKAGYKPFRSDTMTLKKAGLAIIDIALSKATSH